MVRHLRSIRGAMLVLGCAMAGGACITEEPVSEGTASTEQRATNTPTSSAVLRNASGGFVATVLFTAAGANTVVFVAVRLPAEATDTVHGFHVHANDVPANGNGCIADPAQPANTHFVSADGHFNPGGGVHGAHAGDMPPLFVPASGNSTASFITSRFRPGDVLGRAVILHAGSDNLGNIPLGAAATQYTANTDAAVTLTNVTGNAGNRIGCGLVQ
jgi:superoxide dismutase, Cu-Zn family